MFLRQLEVGRFAVFAYLIGSEPDGEGLVIDPADDTEEIIHIAQLQGIKIKYIVNTHGHVDHIMGNAQMKEKTGAAIIIHEEDAPLLTHTPRTMLAMFGAQPSPPADLTVKDGDVLKLGKMGIHVIHTPGHSPGGISLYFDQAVFTGDTLFVGGVGRTDLPGGSWSLLWSSLQNKLFSLPDETIVYPGHNYGVRPTSTIGHERRFNPFINESF